MPISTTSVIAVGRQSRDGRGERLLVVAADHQERRGETAVRDRDAGERPAPQSRSSRRHDVVRHARRRQRERFFAAAPEHERVAALQTHDASPAPRGADHQRVDRRPASAHGGPARLPTKKRCACRA